MLSYRDLSDPGLLHRRWTLYCLSHQTSPGMLEWVAYPFSRGIFPTQVSKLGSPALQVDSLPPELVGDIKGSRGVG